MIITDEILAAYIDGTLPQNQVEEVRQYLASHPQKMEQMVRAMDAFPREAEEDYSISQAALCNLKNSNIASSGAAFVVKSVKSKTNHPIRKTNIQANLTHLLSELI